MGRKGAACLLALLAGCASRRPLPAPAAAGAGQAHFRSYCAACHQYDGQGMGDAPPLDGSPWVSQSPERLIKLVLHGVRGRMEVGGKVYAQEMPGFGQVLGDADIAALVSYVRRRFGGSAQPVRAETVREIRLATSGRTGYWTVDELLEER